MQGYNAQAVTTHEQIVLAAEVTVTSSDSTHLAAMITAACEELHAAGITKPPEVVVADAGYWNRSHIEHLVNQGIQTLVCPEALNRAAPRPGRDGGLYAFMRRVLESEAGHALYKQRQAMIEPVFAHIKHNRRADRFQRRGRAALPLRVAPHHRHPQSPEAPQAPDSPRGGLKRPERASRAHHRPPPSGPPPRATTPIARPRTITRQPRRGPSLMTNGMSGSATPDESEREPLYGSPPAALPRRSPARTATPSTTASARSSASESVAVEVKVS
jgi:Transposase DDE domain